MTNIIISESYPPLREEDVVRVEQQLGITLPDDYREFLLMHNGGHPEPKYFPIKDNPSDDHGILEWFYCIQEGEYYDLRRQVQLLRGRIPPNLLPIADDPGGNLLCMSVAGPDQNTVYFWAHEEECEEGETPTYDNVYFVANSFSDLLGSLTHLPE